MINIVRKFLIKISIKVLKFVDLSRGKEEKQIKKK